MRRGSVAPHKRPSGRRPFGRKVPAPHAARASTRAHLLKRECAADSWTAHRHDRVSV